MTNSRLIGKEVKQRLFSPHQRALSRSTARDRTKGLLVVSFSCTISCLVGVKNNHSPSQKVWLFIQSFTLVCLGPRLVPGCRKVSQTWDFLLNSVWRETWNCKPILGTRSKVQRDMYKVPCSLKTNTATRAVTRDSFRRDAKETVFLVHYDK